MSRVAIVTGGTRGIGKGISLTLRDKGYTVVANYAGNDRAAEEFTKETGLPACKWDVGDHLATLAGCARVAEEVGPREGTDPEPGKLLEVEVEHVHPVGEGVRARHTPRV